VNTFLSDIEKRLREVSLNAPSYEELQAIHMARRLYLPSQQSFLAKGQASKAKYEKMNNTYQYFFSSYDLVKENQQVTELIQDMSSYRKHLKWI